MPVRKQIESQLLELLQEALTYQIKLGAQAVPPEDARFTEWQRETARLLRIAFGELSVHFRAFRRQEGRETCLARARRALAVYGIPNPFLLVEDGLSLPDFARNRAWVADLEREDALWSWRLSDDWQDRWKL
ncbi:hypothetical protein [Tumebacillus flagellatus]|uniref:Uncharacterized protein n=1 Tax=Tumebacillus flagellatus TaxID=1157490 RepID=A0A074LRX8_9BACL|nr:hypothetical protein [Tumebacillus flagellatus]KEO83225.1 hypothetical protein EL26_11065 [Tumebacillus flagellatus]